MVLFLLSGTHCLGRLFSAMKWFFILTECKSSFVLVKSATNYLFVEEFYTWVHLSTGKEYLLENINLNINPHNIHTSASAEECPTQKVETRLIELARFIWGRPSRANNRETPSGRNLVTFASLPNPIGPMNWGETLHMKMRIHTYIYSRGRYFSTFTPTHKAKSVCLELYQMPKNCSLWTHISIFAFDLIQFSFYTIRRPALNCGGHKSNQCKMWQLAPR